MFDWVGFALGMALVAAGIITALVVRGGRRRAQEEADRESEEDL